MSKGLLGSDSQNQLLIMIMDSHNQIIKKNTSKFHLDIIESITGILFCSTCFKNEYFFLVNIKIIIQLQQNEKIELLKEANKLNTLNL